MAEDGRLGAPGQRGVPAELVDTILQVMPDAAVVVDAAGRIVAANAAAEAMFGYGSGALVDMAVDLLVPDRLRNEHARHRDSYAAHPSKRPIGTGLGLWAVRQDGSELPVDISLAPLGDSGDALTLAAVRDLTGLRAEWEAQARLAAIVSSSDDAIVSIDLRGTVTSWNPGAQRLLGFEAQEIVGRPMWRLVPESLRVGVEEQLARVRSGMHIPPTDTSRMHKSGREVEVAESLSLICDPSGAPTGTSALMRDITERKRAERELRRLLVDAQRRERWLSAISEVRLAMLGGGRLDQWLALMSQRVTELTDADGVTVSIPSGHDGKLLEVIAAHGDPVEEVRGLVVPVADSVAGQVFSSGRSTVFAQAEARSGTALAEAVAERVGPMLLVPLATAHGVDGVLGIVRLAGRSAFTPEEIRVAESFGQQAGLAIELDRAQTDREQLALIGDRERIARDLHDHVIQRLFAVGMVLQGVSRGTTDTTATEKINECVEELDATIRDVRSTIFSLAIRATDKAGTSTRAQILDVGTGAVSALGFQPRIQFDGPVDAKVPDAMVPDVLAVLREALSNAARHAHATRVEVQIEVHDDLTVTVTDDGRGMGTPTRSSGLSNMRARAETYSGEMTVADAPGGGTRLRWRVPLG